MKNNICYIFGAGEHFGPPPLPNPGDFVIAADGGYEYLALNGVRADLAVGDFDSLGAPPRGANTIALPREKDDTDMAAALRAGLERGWREFRIYGGTGGRFDHTLANVQCLAELASQGARGFLFGRDTAVTVIRDGSVSFPAGCAGTVSVFAHSDVAEGVFEDGLKYPLRDATLYNTRPLGVSNEFTGAPAFISVRTGTLIIITPIDARETEGATLKASERSKCLPTGGKSACRQALGHFPSNK